MTFNTAFLCASPGFSQNLVTARTADAMPGRVIVTTHTSAPTAFRYGNVDIYFFSSGVCGSFGFERVGTPNDAGTLLAFCTTNFFAIDFMYKR